ncbi:hypothetical protein [Burkholderia gladioli]|uniref:Uncharacterized protein n=1 Tax=Burkholderia gladioli TaxID=28095 RepID=A0AAW3EUL7_BURGA|nr:hypothetical protein [Burkholderia gladioli]AJW99583.1 hypothetical protein BM43_3059 [Burkholderia gladioli]ASD79031.1 hypothetical protein CEJ98_08410 [Burkholderia gladioli pv. gladioli]AWY55728.1 hypothetical protein A8H28_32745 [Burkholderia gladioli pv. gladioli]KGC09400.1 hypothetical protein DM48_5785 [Burkholderia gladioli]KGC10325.1 hypothetical protein DM48_5837 [Burkholderia gladioli]
MQRIPKAIPPAQLGTAAAPLYTAPSSTTATVNNFSLTNTTGSPVPVTLYVVPSGGVAGAANTILSAFSLSAGQSYVPPQTIGLQLAPGSSLQALAGTATAVTAAGGVYETSGS